MSLLLLQNIEGDNAASELTNCSPPPSGKTNSLEATEFMRCNKVHEIFVDIT